MEAITDRAGWVEKCANTYGVTDAQAEHIVSIASQFGAEMTRKYADGVHVHGGNLWERSEEYLLTEAIKEALDQVVYLLTLRQKMAERKSLEAAHV